MELKLSHGRFYGDVVKSREVAGLVLNETRYSAGVRIPRHSHEHSYMCLILCGGYTETFGQRTRECEPSTVAFHPAGETHSERFHQSDVRSFNIELEPHWQERIRPFSPILDNPADFRGGNLARLALRLYREFEIGDDLAALAIEGLVLEVIAQASRCFNQCSNRVPPRWLKQTRDLLHAKFTEGLSLSSLADSVGIHPVYLAKEFRRFHDCTVGEYVRRLRIDYACRELARNHEPLATIALSAGFSDQSHFCRTFKRFTGMTPSEYKAIFNVVEIEPRID